MALFNYASKEITLKVVYYGPGLSGKTTNLQRLHPLLDKDGKTKLISLATESDRTLFFDFMPVALGKIKDFSIRFQLYTVPGQVRYNATRKLVLKGADAIVFIADSQRDMREQNIESYANMLENLAANNIDPDDIPVVLQYNKRDLAGVLSEDELNRDLNLKGYQFVPASAINGTGVEDTFRLVIKLLFRDISRKHKITLAPPEEEAPAVAPPSETAALEAAPAAPPEAVFEEAVSMEELIERPKESGLEETPEEAWPQITEGLLSGGISAIGEEETAMPKEELSPLNEEAPLLGETVWPAEFEASDLEREIIRASMPEETAEPGSGKKLDASLDNLSEIIASINSSVSELVRAGRESKAEMGLKDFSKLSSSIENTLQEVSREIKDMKAKQGDMLKALRELTALLKGGKEKKGWGIFK